MSKVLRQHHLLSKLNAGMVFDFVWDNAVEGMAFVGTDGAWLAVNPALCKWLGYAPTELENMTFMDVTEASDTKADLEAVNEVIRGVRSAYTMTKQYRPKAGPPFAAKLTVLPWRDDAGKDVVFFYSQIQKMDIVQIQKADELRVVWNFCGQHKRLIVMAFVAVALAGDGFLTWLKSVLDSLTAFGGGP